MSTRSTILITGLNKYNNPEGYNLYKHSDGYPSHTLEMLAGALKNACDLILKVANEDRTHEKKTKFLNIKAVMSYKPTERFERVAKLSPALVAGKIIGEGADEYGMGVQFEQAFRMDNGSTMTPLDIPGDVEWVYVINTESMTCDVFNGAGEMKDPMEYVEQIREECKASEAKWIQEGIDAITALGFTINANPYKVRRVRDLTRQLPTS